MQSPQSTTEDETLRRGLTLRRVLALARPEARRLGIGTIFLFVGSAAGLYFPQLAREIIDTALEVGSRRNVDRAALILAGVFALQGVAVAIRYKLFTEAGERIVVDLRNRIFASIVDQEVAFFDERRTGELISRLSNDASVLQNTVSVNISMALRNVVMALGGVMLLFVTSPQLTLIMLAVVPLVVVGALYFGRLVQRVSFQAQEELARAGQAAEETISSIRTVRSFAREEYEKQRYVHWMERYFDAARRRIRDTAIFTGASTIAGYGAIAVVLWYGGRLVLDEAMSVGDLTQFILYTLLVAAAVGVLGTLYADFMKARGAAGRVFELLDRLPAIPRSEGLRLDDVRGEIAFEAVSFSYPSRPETVVLKALDLKIHAGDVVALVGSSGAGKSTVTALLRRFYDVSSGSITLDDVDIRELDPAWLREEIATVDQEPQLLSTSIEENIRYGRLDASDEEVREAAAQANALQFIESFEEGFATPVGERGVQLSGGQKQRIAIARALLKDPAILLLDEATSALDAESEYLVQEGLERLMRGRTVLIIAHRLSTVAKADRIYVFDDGRVVEEGTFDDLSQQKGVFAQLIERQQL